MKVWQLDREIKIMICSPIVSKSGAINVHNNLEGNISDYKVVPFSPYLEYFPFMLRGVDVSDAKIIHTSPDHGFFFKRRDIPLVLTFHNYVLDKYMNDYSTIMQSIHYKTDLRYFIKKSVENASRITCVSNFTAKLVEKELNVDNTTVIYNGVDENRFIPVNKKRNSKILKVLFSGNLTKRKGAHLLPKIASKLDGNIIIYYTKGLRTKSKLPSLPNLVPLKPIPYNEMPDLYKDMDILLFPSVREGLSLSALEAMSCGLPIIASDGSSFPELIENGEGGFLCDLNSIEQFAQSINRMASDYKLRSDMGEHNRSKIEERFRLSDMVYQYQELFETVV